MIGVKTMHSDPDIGFSGSQKTRRIEIGEGMRGCVDFPEAQKRVVDHTARARSLMIDQ
jgi:hypothetical protein